MGVGYPRPVNQRLQLMPPAGLHVGSLAHIQRRREARQRLLVGLFLGHPLRVVYDDQCGRYALDGFSLVVHRLFEDRLFVGYASRLPLCLNTFSKSGEQFVCFLANLICILYRNVTRIQSLENI